MEVVVRESLGDRLRAATLKAFKSKRKKLSKLDDVSELVAEAWRKNLNDGESRLMEEAERGGITAVFGWFDYPQDERLRQDFVAELNYVAQTYAEEHKMTVSVECHGSYIGDHGDRHSLVVIMTWKTAYLQMELHKLKS